LGNRRVRIIKRFQFAYAAQRGNSQHLPATAGNSLAGLANVNRRFLAAFIAR
jgi:hypothetical protein